jgi:hypothetical protein
MSCRIGIVLVLAAVSWSQAAAQPEPTTEFINQYFREAWKAQKLKPAERCSDPEFLRRVMLDVIGRIPTVEELETFAKDQAPDKRVLLVSRLILGEEYDAYWARVWASWLLPRTLTVTVSERMGPGFNDFALVPRAVQYPPVASKQLELWLEEQLSQGVSYRDLVKQLLTASGRTNENGSVNFLLAHLGEPFGAAQRSKDGGFDMVPATLRTTRLFLGYRLDGCQFDDQPRKTEWKQMQFYQLNAFLRQVERVGTPPDLGINFLPASLILELRDNSGYNTKGIVFYEKRSGVFLPAEPTYLSGDKLRPGGQLTRREALSKFITTDPQFARAFVNRMWGQFFGRGLHQRPEVDDFGGHHQLVHPDLLDRLAKDFADGKFSIGKLIYWIATSDVYQLRCAANETNAQPAQEAYFSRMPLKLLSPEQLVEALLTTAYPKAEEREVFRGRLLRFFDRRFENNEWEDVPARDRLAHLLALLNRKELTDHCVSDRSSSLRRALAQPDPLKAADALFLAVLGRRPAEAEQARIQKEVEQGKKKLSEVWQDLLWALLNSGEFVLNH